MGQFQIIFLDLGVDAAPVPERYREYFLSYDPAGWNGGSGDGSFIYFDDDDRQYSLLVSHEPGIGISLMYGVMERNGGGGTEAVSVGDAAAINEFLWTGNELWMPRGSFMQPQHAWLAVEDFINAPILRSARVEWLDTNTLDWPEM